MPKFIRSPLQGAAVSPEAALAGVKWPCDELQGGRFGLVFGRFGGLACVVRASARPAPLSQIQKKQDINKHIRAGNHHETLQVASHFHFLRIVTIQQLANIAAIKILNCNESVQFASQSLAHNIAFRTVRHCNHFRYEARRPSNAILSSW